MKDFLTGVGACLGALIAVTVIAVAMHNPEEIPVKEDPVVVVQEDPVVLVAPIYPALRLDGGGKGSGTGFAIECKQEEYGNVYLILTARHVIPPGLDLEVYNHEGLNLGTAEPYSRCVTADAALFILFTFETVEVFDLSAGKPVMGELVWVSGYPAEMGPWIRSGFFSGERRVSVPGYYGDSGGPVVNSRGEVIGIFHAVLSTERYGLFSSGGFMEPIPHFSGWLYKETLSWHSVQSNPCDPSPSK